MGIEEEVGETREVLTEAVKYGFFGMVHTPKDIRKWIDLQSSGMSEEDKVRVELIAHGIVNAYAIIAAKMSLALKANGLEMEEDV